MSVEIQELRDAVRQVVEAIGKPGSEDEYRRQCTALGWLMVSVPEVLGGLGMPPEAAVAVHLELGRGLCGAPYLTTMMAVEAICQSARSDREALLEQIFAGEQVTASLHNGELSASDGNVFGCLSAMPSADAAAKALLWTQDRQYLLLADLSHPAVKIKPRATWDQTRRLFDLELDALPLSEVTLLAEGSCAKTQIESVLVHRDWGLAADAVGASSAVLDMTVEYLKTRIQFRRPLAMFQALKHRCADMKASVDAVEAMLFCEREQRRGTDAMAAKQVATAGFVDIAEEALQLHGGIGMAMEYPCHLYLKRALLNDQLGRGLQQYTEAAVENLLRAG